LSAWFTVNNLLFIVTFGLKITDDLLHVLQHIAVFNQVSAVTEFSVTGDYLSIVVNLVDDNVHGFDDTVDRPTAGSINKGIETIEVQVAHMNYIAFVKIDDGISVSVRRSHMMNHINGFIVPM